MEFDNFDLQQDGSFGVVPRTLRVTPGRDGKSLNLLVRDATGPASIKGIFISAKAAGELVSFLIDSGFVPFEQGEDK